MLKIDKKALKGKSIQSARLYPSGRACIHVCQYDKGVYMTGDIETNHTATSLFEPYRFFNGETYEKRTAECIEIQGNMASVLDYCDIPYLTFSRGFDRLCMRLTFKNGSHVLVPEGEDWWVSGWHPYQEDAQS